MRATVAALLVACAAAVGAQAPSVGKPGMAGPVGYFCATLDAAIDTIGVPGTTRDCFSARIMVVLMELQTTVRDASGDELRDIDIWHAFSPSLGRAVYVMWARPVNQGTEVRKLDFYWKTGQR